MKFLKPLHYFYQHHVPEESVRFRLKGQMPKFWPPQPNRFWKMILAPISFLHGKAFMRLTHIEYVHVDETFRQCKAGDGILIAPNHSHEVDAYVLSQTSKRVRRHFYYMAAWPAFTMWGGLGGWVLQKMGAFSVDRDGADRRAIRCASDLLSSGETLVIFPEGEIHRLNDRLKPILDGAAFIALNAYHELQKNQSQADIWIVPAAVRYKFVEDIRPEMEKAIADLEKHFAWYKSKAQATLRDRIVALGELILTIKEKEKLGNSYENEHDLPKRIQNLIDALLSRHEKEYSIKSSADESTSLRVKALRRKSLEIWTNEEESEEARTHAKQVLDDVQLSLQLSSYPGDYIAEEPSIERMAETIEKFQEDIYGAIRPIGKRKAWLIFGEPISLKSIDYSRHKRDIITGLTSDIEQAITDIMKRRPF